MPSTRAAGSSCGVERQELFQALHAKELSRGIARFGDSIREEEEQIAGLERNGHLVVDLAFPHAQREVVAVQDLVTPGPAVQVNDPGMAAIDQIEAAFFISSRA